MTEHTPTTPDPNDIDRNLARVARGRAILRAYAAIQPGINMQEALDDVQSDLMHCAYRDLLDFQGALKRGHVNFMEETDADGIE